MEIHSVDVRLRDTTQFALLGDRNHDDPNHADRLDALQTPDHPFLQLLRGSNHPPESLDEAIELFFVLYQATMPRIYDVKSEALSANQRYEPSANVKFISQNPLSNPNHFLHRHPDFTSSAIKIILAYIRKYHQTSQV
jgi:hypothetical protein